MTDASTPTCRHETCVETSFKAKGFCRFHYNQFIRYGETYDGRRNARKQCGAKDCTNPTVAHGLCERHYRPGHRTNRLHESKRSLNRVCTGCGEPIPDTARYGAIFCSTECRVRTSNFYRALRRHDLTLDQHQALLEQQDHRCAICGVHEDSTLKRLAIDHDHKTGRVRGLLCSPCNTALGQFKDDPSILKNAIRYLDSGGTL
jgi:Recombination endonuclease VII